MTRRAGRGMVRAVDIGALLVLICVICLPVWIVAGIVEEILGWREGRRLRRMEAELREREPWLFE